MRRSSFQIIFTPSGKSRKIELQRFVSTYIIPKFCAWCGGVLKKKFVPVENCKRLVCQKCAFLTYLNPNPVAGVIPEQNGKIVLLRRGIEPSKGKWTYPAGFVELGETLPGAACRETLEETGLKVNVGGLIGVYSYPNFGVIVVVYSAKVLSGKFRTSHETAEVREFSKDTIPWKDLAFRSTRDALKEWVQSRRV